MDHKLAMRLQQGFGFPEFQYSDSQNQNTNNQNQHVPPSSEAQSQVQPVAQHPQTTQAQQQQPSAGIPGMAQRSQNHRDWEVFMGLSMDGENGANGPQTRSSTANSQTLPQQPMPLTTGGTTQPLWSLYPAASQQQQQVGINQISDGQNRQPPPQQQHSAALNNNTTELENEFMPYTSESHQQRQNLLQNQHDRATHSYDLPYYDPNYRNGMGSTTHTNGSSAAGERINRHSSPRPGPSTANSYNNNNNANNMYQSHQQSHAHTPEVEDHLAQQRAKYKAKSSIPPDLSHSNYAQQCISAANSSRLPPFALHTEEYNLLRSHLPYMHVTTYLNIRNGILRLWLSNPMVNVTMAEAAGCVRDDRYYGLAEVAYDFLVRHGYINFGCVENLAPDAPYDNLQEEEKQPRKTIVVIGAGVAGLGAARQLDALFRRYSHFFTDYEDIPRIIVLEGRRRIGGRIYSAPLKTDHDCMVDLGAQMIMGYGKGNPLAVLARRQLGLPVIPVEPPTEVYDSETGEQISGYQENRIDKLFHHVMDRMAEFKNKMPSPNTASGDEVLMRAAKDPSTTRDDEFELQTIAKLEENGELPKPYDNPGDLLEQKIGDDPETEEETKFLKSVGVNVKSNKGSIHVAPEPQGEMYPSLGKTMDSMVEQLQEMGELKQEDLRLLNWHYANLEFSFCTNLDNLSLSHWNQDEGNEFAGRHSMVQTGYQSLTRGLYVYPEKLDVRFKTSVKVIEYDNDQTHVFLENGERITADRVLSTVPLGILKDRMIQFIPDLPQWKTDSIERLGFGVMNKVCLVFDHIFWDESKDIVCVARGSDSGTDGTKLDDYKSSRGMFYMFWNCTKQVGKPCLMAIVSGDAALQLANESDDDIVENACFTLKKIFKQEFRMVESVVTRWQIDPFSRGSYSYLGMEATGADYDLMARPVGNSLFFSGEATCRARPGTVHGAYISGLRAANEILTSLIGDVEVPHPLIPTRDQVNASRIHSAPPGQQVGKYPVRSSMPSPAPEYQQYDPAPMTRNAAAAVGVGGNIGGARPGMMGRNQSNTSLQSEEHIPTLSGVSAPGPRPGSRAQQTYPLKRKNSAVSESESPEALLKQLKEKRITDDNEKMRADMTKELGHRPVKPERSGANPFLIFQKDFWDKCRQDTDKEKQKQTGDPKARAARNDVRAALGKMWRELPEDEKRPYLEATKEIKESNNRNLEEYRKLTKVYDADAEDFRRRWKEENASQPSEEELRLQQIVQEQERRARKKHHK